MGFQGGAPEPRVWQHDLFSKDHSPYDGKEIAFFKDAIAKGPALEVAVEGRWPVGRAWEWYEKQPWLVGCNFLPSTAVNDVEMWQEETFDPRTIDRELDWAEGLGFNTVRVFINFVVWEAEAAGFKKRFDQFLAIAQRHGISTMTVLLDDCFKQDPKAGQQPDPVPGEHNSQWVASPGKATVMDPSKRGLLERYVKDMVSSFAHDQRIMVWDLYNEPAKESLPLVEASFRWAREAGHDQPLTTCFYGSEGSERYAELSDVISFHAYTDLANTRNIAESLSTPGRPVLCTEWMTRTENSRFETLLPFFKERRVGCWSWGLVAGRIQTYFPWGSPKGAPEPELWFHDILRKDGTPKDPAEVTFIRTLTNAPGVNRLKPLFDFPVRDTCVCLRPDKTYYLTGTTGAPTWWKTNEGIRMWKSRDLKTWEPMGLVWSFEKNMTWQKKQGENQAIWAPELHYFNNTSWITYCVNYPRGGTGILKSSTGRPEGPYVDIKPDGPLTDEIDASLFRDDDGKVYFVYQDGKIARMKEDMSGFAEAPRFLKPANADHVSFEGAFLFKANNRYYLSCAEFIDDRYHGFVASSKDLLGPYGNRYLV